MLMMKNGEQAPSESVTHARDALKSQANRRKLAGTLIVPNKLLNAV